MNTERATKKLASEQHGYDLAADAVIYQGGMVLVAGGTADAASEVAGAFTAGVATHSANQADGDTTIVVDTGTFHFNNSAAADEIAAADIGADCFVVDGETVAKTDGGGTRSRAGLIRNVDASGVWVTIA